MVLGLTDGRFKIVIVPLNCPLGCKGKKNLELSSAIADGLNNITVTLSHILTHVVTTPLALVVVVLVVHHCSQESQRNIVTVPVLHGNKPVTLGSS